MNCVGTTMRLPSPGTQASTPDRIRRLAHHLGLAQRRARIVRADAHRLRDHLRRTAVASFDEIEQSHLREIENYTAARPRRQNELRGHDDAAAIARYPGIDTRSDPASCAPPWSRPAACAHSPCRCPPVA